MFNLIFSSVAGPVILVLLGLVLVAAAVVATWKKVPSDMAAVVVGLGRPKVLHGEGGVVIPILQRIDYITLESISIPVNVVQTKTKLGVPIDAQGTVVIKVKSDEQSIKSAIEQFNRSNSRDTLLAIQSLTSEVCSGKLREIVSSMSVEDIYDNREAFASNVQRVAGDELAAMGLEIKSFTINDITDKDGYIEAMGKEQIAKVKAHAAIAEAQAKKEQAIETAEALKEQQIRTAEAERRGKQAQLIAETEIAQAEKEKALSVHAYRQEQEASKAKADAAYQIQENITSQEVKNTAMDVVVLERQREKDVREAEVEAEIAAEAKNIELAKRRAERKEAELEETVVKTAEANRRQAQIKADAAKYEEIAKAEAEAEKLRLQGEAEARVIEAKSKAEAEHIRMQGEAEAMVIEAKGKAEADSILAKGLAEAEALDKKADALAKMDEAGKIQMITEILPAVASAVAAPMSQIDKVTIIGGSGEGGGGAADMAKQHAVALKVVQESIKDLTGFDISESLRANTYDAKVNRNITISTNGDVGGVLTPAIAGDLLDTDN